MSAAARANAISQISGICQRWQDILPPHLRLGEDPTEHTCMVRAIHALHYSYGCFDYGPFRRDFANHRDAPAALFFYTSQRPQTLSNRVNRLLRTSRRAPCREQRRRGVRPSSSSADISSSRSKLHSLCHFHPFSSQQSTTSSRASTRSGSTKRSWSSFSCTVRRGAALTAPCQSPIS